MNAKKIITGKLKELLKSPASLPPVIRVETETGPLDLLQWLDSQKDNTKIYFSGRDKIDIETAATGAVDTIYIPGN
ncbi:MAG: hypothetical protein GY757_12715, partial [bacterium]|nr:hypothetical protein [bacterium]